jgi:hypothetical protein
MDAFEHEPARPSCKLPTGLIDTDRARTVAEIWTVARRAQSMGSTQYASDDSIP